MNDPMPPCFDKNVWRLSEEPFRSLCEKDGRYSMPKASVIDLRLLRNEGVRTEARHYFSRLVLHERSARKIRDEAALSTRLFLYVSVTMPRASSVAEVDEDAFVGQYRGWEADRRPDCCGPDDASEGFLRTYHRRALDRTLGTFERNLWRVADLSRAWAESPVRLDFAPIEQRDIREQAKSACVKLLADGADPAQLEEGLDALTRLCAWLFEAAPGTARLEDVSRMETARYRATLKNKAKGSNGVATEMRRLKGFFSQMASTSGGPVLPVADLFEASDLAPSAASRKRPFSMHELRALNRLLQSIDVQAARIAVVLQRTDAAFGDIARLERGCITSDAAGDMWLLYGRRKNGSPKGMRADAGLVSIVEAAAADSDARFGKGCNLVFAWADGDDGAPRCMTGTEFAAQVARASKACGEKDDSGGPLSYSRGSFKGAWLCDASSIGLCPDVYRRLGKERT